MRVTLYMKAYFCPHFTCEHLNQFEVPRVRIPLKVPPLCAFVQSCFLVDYLPHHREHFGDFLYRVIVAHRNTHTIGQA